MVFVTFCSVSAFSIYTLLHNVGKNVAGGNVLTVLLLRHHDSVDPYNLTVPKRRSIAGFYIPDCHFH